MQGIRFSPHTERVISIRSKKDPKTVRAFFDGKPVREGTREAIEAALAELRAEGVEIVVAS